MNLFSKFDIIFEPFPYVVRYNQIQKLSAFIAYILPTLFFLLQLEYEGTLNPDTEMD